MTSHNKIAGLALVAWANGGNLHRANLSGADLGGANFRGEDLIDASLSHAYLSGANLIEADLRGANLHRADLNRADLRWADLRGADLSDANLSGANLSGADLLGARIGRHRLVIETGRLIRSDGYEFRQFLTMNNELLIRAGCRTFTQTEYRLHVETYKSEEKRRETIEILDKLL